MSLVRRVPERTERVDVRITPMKRRHLRQVMKIEDKVYPRPWTLSVFHGELAQHDGSRCYVVAKVSGHVVGYAGFLVSLGDGHVTNVAVDPAWQRHKIGTRLMLTLGYQARARGLENLTLEVRVSNKPAQTLYHRFGFAPAGIRTKYYENVEDAIIMWSHDIDQPAYAERLRAIEAELPGTTTWEGLA
jgi:[ribosomal protein S18]-alanine N-acetyltransferase